MLPHRFAIYFINISVMAEIPLSIKIAVYGLRKKATDLIHRTFDYVIYW